MSDYQAIYDAVRSKIIGGNVADATERAIRDVCDASHAIACLQQEFSLAAYEMARPSTVLRPAISIDGNKWCALYGANLQDGVAGFGDSPAEAFAEFDKAWQARLGSAKGDA
jgi:hypothetical protein